MRSLKLLFMQASFISTGIFLGVGIAQIIYHLIGDEYISEWYFIPSVLLTGILCSLPVLLIAEENQSHYKLRIAAHFSILFIAVSLLGLLFKWYSNFMGYAIVMLIFICVYVFVWIVTAWIYKEEDKQINTALDSIRDEE
jgi:MFS family permease